MKKRAAALAALILIPLLLCSCAKSGPRFTGNFADVTLEELRAANDAEKLAEEFGGLTLTCRRLNLAEDADLPESAAWYFSGKSGERLCSYQDSAGVQIVYTADACLRIEADGTASAEAVGADAAKAGREELARQANEALFTRDSRAVLQSASVIKESGLVMVSCELQPGDEGFDEYARRWGFEQEPLRVNGFYGVDPDTLRVTDKNGYFLYRDLEYNEDELTVEYGQAPSLSDEMSALMK